MLFLATLAAAQTAAALNADDYRGGWEATSNGTEHVYNFSIRGDKVTGIYCTDCSNATTLAFVDGKLGVDAMTFVVNHVRDDGSTAYLDHVTARIDGDHLAVEGRAGGTGGGHFQWAMHKDPRGPVPAGTVPGAALPQVGAPAPNVAAYGTSGQQPVRFGPGGPPPGLFPRQPWQRPGPWEQLTPAKLTGVWIGFGEGLIKQYFVIRKVGDRLLGVVCGDCSNPYTMAALDGFQIDGGTLKFNIDHEDWGYGKLPFHNILTVKVTRNEMRMVNVQQDNMPPQPMFPGGGGSLIGPLSFEATGIR
jgi:hypothetical protein